jgi:hypothetical protein
MTNLYPIDERLDFGSVLEGDVFARVFIKPRWADAWVERLDIIATQILWAAAPNYGSASIHRRYGPVVERDGTTENRLPIELGGWYVKIVVTCPDGDRNWHGYVIDIGDEPGGVVTVATIPWATGKQTWSCVGMLAALDRDPLKESRWISQTTFDDPDGSLSRTVQSAPWFNPTVQQTVNGQSVSRQMPNSRQGLFHARNYFGGSAEPSYWTPRGIINYLVENAGPKDEESQVRVPLDWESTTQVPDFGRPEIDCEGLTIKQVLDRLLNPSTGLGYWVWVKTPEDEEDPELLVIQPYTLAPEPININLANSWTLAANDHITDLYCGNDPATTYTVQQSLATRYNRVRVVGARRVVVCTKRFTHPDSSSSWRPGWTSADEIAWQITPIPSGTNALESQQRRLDLLEEGRFESVFRLFALRLESLAENEEGVDVFTPALFKKTETSDLEYYLPDRFRFSILPDLPLKSNIDYSLANSDVEHRFLQGARRGIAVYGPQHALTGSFTPGHDAAGAKIDWANRSHVDLFYHIGRPNYQLTPSPYENGLDVGLRLDVNGASQGILSNFTTPLASVQLQFSTFIVTLALEEDRRCEFLYPEDPDDLPDLDAVLELRLDVGDSYRRVDLKKGTVVGFDHTGAYKVVPDDITLENDSEELGRIARLAYEWYNRTRSILRLASRRPTARLWPGVLVRNLNPALTPIAREVNTTITEISITLPTNPGVTPGAPRMEIVTSTGDVDFVRYTPRLRV